MNVQNSNEQMNFIALGAGQELDVSSDVVQAAEMPKEAKYAMVSVKKNAVHMAFMVNPATAGAGVYLPAGTILYLRRYTLAMAKFIRAEADKDATLRIEPGTF
jgi:hypothetical protein